MARARVIGTSIEAIQAAEKELGRTLPEAFRDWLLVNNGRSLGALTLFPVFDERDPRKTWESIVRHFNQGWPAWLEVHAQGASDSAALLPFAEFGTGDYYCFDYGLQGQDGEPVVVLWSHETAQTRDVAEGFADFLRTVERPSEAH